MIIAHELSKKFGLLKAVDDLSFKVEAGEIFALLGPNGAGKTTTIKMILGMLKSDKGSILFNGKELWFGDNSYKARIGYVPENCALYENLTGREYLNFIGNLYHLPPDEIREKAGSLLQMLDLEESSGQLIREYSKGMKQKILIISALLHNPELIILDEPFSGLDANSVSIFKQIMREEAADGKAVIFCSHVLEVVERLVHRILIMKNGCKLVAGTPEEIIRQTGHVSLDRAFNLLTDAGDIEDKAREILKVIGRKPESNKDEQK